jgi:hypothetical protein
MRATSSKVSKGDLAQGRREAVATHELQVVEGDADRERCGVLSALSSADGEPRTVSV